MVANSQFVHNHLLRRILRSIFSSFYHPYGGEGKKEKTIQYGTLPIDKNNV